MGELTFSLKLLERRVAANALEGAFRLHLSTRDRKQLELEIGDLCELSTPAASAAGVAFAWPAQDVNAGSGGNANKRMARAGQMLLDACGVAVNDRVYIRKAKSMPPRAQRVWVREVGEGQEENTGEELQFVVMVALYELKMIAVGGLFDAVVVSQKTMKDQKRHFEVVKIDATEEVPMPPSPSSVVPFSFDFGTKVHFVNSDDDLASLQGLEKPQKAAEKPISLESTGIGGLQKQIEKLNRHLATLTASSSSGGGRTIPSHLRRGGGFLLCGAQGTGKSLLLKKLAEAPWKKVLRIDEARLGPYSRESQKALQTTFAEARASQPSLLLLDNLENLIGKTGSENPSVRSALLSELESLQGTRVVMVAATVNPNDIHTSLRMPETLGTEIEIPVPDADARAEILKVLLEKDPAQADSLCDTVGERTHGYVGRDLRLLCIIALEHAVNRANLNAGKDHGEPGLDASNAGTEPAPRGEVDDPPAIETLVLADFEQALTEVRPTAMKEIFLETPKVRWADIGGSDEVRKAFSKATERPFKRPDIIRVLGLEPPKGILMYGPPGCSKTLTAKAVATESGLNFLAVKGAELTSMYVGESERAIREVFRKARAASPSVLFFDEIDSIGAASEKGSHSTGLNVVTTLLNEMDGIEALKGVLVLAATNKPDLLDPALMRPGRFDTHLYIGPPNEAARRQIFEIRTRRMPLGDDVDLDELARRSEGYSGAEIVRICNEAAERTATQLEQADTGTVAAVVTQREFVEAIGSTPKQISGEMTRRYQDFRDGRTRTLFF